METPAMIDRLNYSDAYRLTFTGAGLSDLFFNHEHPTWSANPPDPDSEEESWNDDVRRKAMLQDAIAFCELFGLPSNFDPMALVDDFFRRL